MVAVNSSFIHVVKTRYFEVMDGPIVVEVGPCGTKALPEVFQGVCSTGTFLMLLSLRLSASPRPVHGRPITFGVKENNSLVDPYTVLCSTVGTAVYAYGECL